MRTRSLVIVSVFSLAMGVFAACGGETPPPETPATPSATPPPPASTPEVAQPEPPKEEPKKEEPPPPPPPKSAKEVVTGGGTFMFSLDDSADAKKMHADECGKKKKQDKIDACMKDVQAAAANEGIRFEKDDKGVWWFVSFGKEKDKDVIYNKVPFKIVKEDPKALTVAQDGKDTGKKPMKMKKDETMTIEVTDDNTVVINDPKKGKLVYKKK